MKKIILLMVCIAFAGISRAQWSGMGTGPGGIVRALCVHNDTLFAGGDFVGLVKKWDKGTSTWTTVGTGLSGTAAPKVNALVSFNGTLYAGGSFTIAGSLKGNIAKWNGTAWAPSESGGLGSTATGTEVKCLYKFSNALYAGGTFNQSGTENVLRIAKLNAAGSAWTQVGGGVPPNCGTGVFAMSAHDNQLFVGGEGTAPFVNKLHITGGSWESLTTTGELSDGDGVYALAVLNHYPFPTSRTLFIGGKFSSGFYNTVCRYSNNSWGSVSSFSAGANDQVNCFVSSSNADSAVIYAGGVFTASSLHSTTNIAKRTVDVDWDSAGTPSFSGAIRALCFYDGYLVAGGDFTSPGAYVSRYSTTVDVEENAENVIMNEFFPNPVIKQAMLRVQTKQSLQQPELKMMDANGNVVDGHSVMTTYNRNRNEVEFRIDREGLAAGIYYYMLEDQRQKIAAGKFVVE